MSAVFLMRHADRDGLPGYDDPINDAGRKRASGISWNCDLVIVSPLRRTHQTLEASNIRYRYRIQSDLCREHLDGAAWNYLPGEKVEPEPDAAFFARVERFREFLTVQARVFSSILVVIHGVFMGTFFKLGRNVGYCEYRQWLSR